MTSRRGFIMSGAAFAALGNLPSFASARRDMKNPDLRVGVISDVHIRSAGDERVLLDVLRWYRNNRVDAVMVAGDVADYGLTWQMDAFMCAWRDVFPDSMIDGTRKVELIYVTGNHEYDIWKRIRGTMYKGDARLEPYVFVKNIEREWKRLFGIDHADTFVREVKGYRFFCSNFLSWNHAENLTAVQGLFERERAFIPADRPFFYMQHLPIRGTCGYASGGADAMTAFCSRYPNMVAITGHTHDSLADDRSFWRAGFTCVNAGTLQHVTMPKGSPERKVRNYPQGLLMRIWPDYVHFERRDFKNRCRFDPAWESSISTKKEGQA